MKFPRRLDYISKWTNISKTSVIATLKALTESGYLNKKEAVVGNVRFCSYTTNYEQLLQNLTSGKETLPVVNKYGKGGKETLPGSKDSLSGGKETLPNIDNNIDNNINNRNNKENSENLFSLSTELSITAKEISVDTRVFKKVDNLLSSVVFPFDEIEFKKKFFVLCCMPKWRTKTIHAIQMQLNKLQEYELDFVMELIDNSIMNEWQGIVYQDTPKRYQEWLRSKSSGNRAGGIKQITDPVERENMMQYLNKDSDLWK